MSRTPHSWLTTALRDALRTLARRKVAEADVEDIVQVVLVEAATSPHRPEDPTSARKWIYGILRNKIADYHRRPKREELVPEVRDDEHGPQDAQDAQEVRSLLEWAMRELPSGMDARRTLEWLVRESEGETLEEIARSEQLPPEQVRQRVSRLRRFFRERRVATAVGFAVLVAISVAILWPDRRRPLDLQADNTHRPTPRDVRQAGPGDAGTDARPIEDVLERDAEDRDDGVDVPDVPDATNARRRATSGRSSIPWSSSEPPTGSTPIAIGTSGTSGP